MRNFYSKACIFVSTNLYGNKTIPVIEAMLFGLPVICFKILDEQELIKDGKNGFLVPPGDYKMLAERILLLLKNASLRERMGKFAREWILKNHPSWEKRIKGEIEIINRLI